MAVLTIPLSDERQKLLQCLADQSGVSPEELARSVLEEWMSRSDGDFARAAEYVLRKNAELYRRLA